MLLLANSCDPWVSNYFLQYDSSSSLVLRKDDVIRESHRAGERVRSNSLIQYGLTWNTFGIGVLRVVPSNIWILSIALTHVASSQLLQYIFKLD